MNDVDLEMVELAAAGTDIANGVCPICDEALNPLDPKWAGDYGEHYTAENAAAAVGPAHPTLPYHANCLRS